MVWVLGVCGFLVVVMDLGELAEFLMRVMRLIYLVSDLVMGGRRSLMLSTPEEDWVIDHMPSARR